MQGNNAIQVSIIVPTYNRKEYLERLLGSFASVAYPFEAMEVIIVDNASDDGTRELLAGGNTAWPFFLKTVTVPGKCTPGTLRNRGVQEACGDILVFVDSDCLVTRDWLRALTAVFNDAAVGAAGGPDVRYPDDPPFALCVNYIMTSFLTTGGLRGTTGKKAFPYHPRSFNMAVRRSLFDAAGGFADRFYGEDVLLSARIGSLGYQLRCVEEAVVAHARKTTAFSFVRQLFCMGKARAEIARQVPTVFTARHGIPAVHALFLLSLPFLCRMHGAGTVVAGWYGIVIAVFLIVLGIDFIRKTKLFWWAGMAVCLFFLQQIAYGAGLIAGAVTLLHPQRKEHV